MAYRFKVECDGIEADRRSFEADGAKDAARRFAAYVNAAAYDPPIKRGQCADVRVRRPDGQWLMFEVSGDNSPRYRARRVKT